MKRTITMFLAGLLLTALSVSAQSDASGPVVMYPVYFDVSPPLRDMVKQAPSKVDMTWKDGVVKNYLQRNNKGYNPSKNQENYDPVLQDYFGDAPTDTTIANFEGVNNIFGGVPPDTDGDVGPGHYFQVVNVHYAIYNKSGVKLLGPSTNSSIFSGLPNNSNDGDAIVLYDEVADRWIFSQFSLPNYPNGPFFEMIAVSQTGDPTGSWYRYQFQFNTMPDYPKLAVWPDGIYMTCNRFNSSGNYQGVGVYAMNRTKMYAGQPNPEMISFNLNSSNNAWRMLPSDCDGEYPPAGTPNYVAYHNDGPDQIVIYEFHADFVNTANSTFNQTNTLTVASFNGNHSGIPQKGTTIKLDPFSGTFMNRLPFRKFSDHWSMVGCAAVNVGNNVAGVRWYELRKTTTTDWGVYQSGTYAPDNHCRWMCSIAMDGSGNIAVGYNISSSDMYPSIRYTGRMAADPLGEMTIEEGGIINGGGYQNNTWSGNPSRWGDYAAMAVDPVDPATFWYTTEYYQTTSQSNWKTRIGSFSFANVLSVTTTAEPDVICQGDTSQLTAEASGGSGTFTYTWTSNPAGFNSTQQNPEVWPTETTTYYVEVSDGTLSKTDSVEVTVNFTPIVNAGIDTVYCTWIPNFMTNGSGEGASSYKWVTSGTGTFQNAANPKTKYTPTIEDKNSGSITLTLTGYPKIPCTDSTFDQTIITFDPCTGIPEEDRLPFGVSVHPNPATDLVNLSITGVKNTTVQWTLTDLQGRIMVQESLDSRSGMLEKSLSVGNLPSGTYLLTVTSGKGTATTKVILQ